MHITSLAVGTDVINDRIVDRGVSKLRRPGEELGEQQVLPLRGELHEAERFRARQPGVPAEPQCVVLLVGAVTNKVSMPADLWVITGLCVWIGSLLFAAFGLFVGYLLPSENVMQIIGLALTLCCFAGGLFIPLSQFPPGLLTLARFTPLYGLNQLVHYPLAGGTLQWAWVLNLAVWLAIFVAGAAWRLRRDTARV